MPLFFQPDFFPHPARILVHVARPVSFPVWIMEIIRSVSEVRSFITEYRKSHPDHTVSFVPTMGYLHEGHLALFREAKREGDLTLANIFVNRLQFNNPDDFSNYPRNTERDAELCKSAGIDLLFLPSHEEIYENYPPAIRLSMPEMTRHLCGRGRPGHFEGVMYIVARFFHLLQPSVAFFGKKDYQQLRVIERMVADLDFPVVIRSVDTVREADGLAMSSRNARLSAAAREQANLIFRALKLVETTLRDGGTPPAELVEIGTDVIHSGFLNKVEYFSIVDPKNLSPIETEEELSRHSSVVIATAVLCDGIRLIDNLEVQR